MEDEFDYSDFEIPINIGVGSTILDLLTSVLGSKSKETQFEKDFKYNYLQGYNHKYEKWLEILKNDLITKGKYSHSEVQSIISSEFVDLYFNKYLKKIYYLYFAMGFARNTKSEEKVFKELKQPIEKITAEFIDMIQKNVSEDQFKTIYGPIVRSFYNDAYIDGIGYSAYTALESLKNTRW